MIASRIVTAASVLALGLLASTASFAQTVVEVLRQQPDLGRFAQIVERSGLAAQLSGAGPFTLYAPTDRAIEALPFAERQRLEAASAEDLRGLVLAHTTNYGQSLIMEGGWQTRDYPTLAGRSIRFERQQNPGQGNTGSTMLADGVTVTDNLRASNGYVHRLGGVLAAR